LISQQIANLTAWLRPAPGNARILAVEIARLLAAFPSQTAGDSATDLRIEAYMEAISDAPEWAVSEARLACIRGEAGLDNRFAPTPAQFASLVSLRTRRVKRDLADLERIQRAADGHVPAPAPAERAKVAAGFDKLKLDLTGTVN
jgi:hypothetical protein